MSEKVSIRLVTGPLNNLVKQVVFEVPLKPQSVPTEDAPWVVILVASPQIIRWGTRTFLRTSPPEAEAKDMNITFRETFCVDLP